MKQLLTILLIAAGLHAAAQNVKLGFKAAVQMNALTGYETKYDKFSGTKPGWLAGPTAEFKLSDNAGVQTGLLFSTQGGDLGPYTIKIYAAQLPAIFVYRRQQFFIGAGPVFSYGVYGRIEGGQDWNESRDLYEENSALPLKRPDVQAHATMGFDISKKFQVSSFYSKGLLNLNNRDDKEYTYRLNSYGIALNYTF